MASDTEIAQSKRRRQSQDKCKGKKLRLDITRNSKQALLKFFEIYVKYSTVPYNQCQIAS